MFKRMMQIVALCAMTAAAQADPIVLTENFDDPILEGWAATNLSTPGGTTSWFLGNAGVFTAQAGADDSYAAANFLNAGFGGDINNWLFTPVLDFSHTLNLSFYTRAAGVFPDRLEIYASNAGASTSVGDFTLLLSINALLGADYPTIWSQFSALYGGTGTGDGRFAFRYYVTDTSINGDYIGIDTIRVAQAPEPASIALLALGMLALASMRRRRTARR